ncbi:MAG TPA: GNAT family N-acetyltransferase [Chloroflexota bacterium]|nr:GNAT family N-acetyltransferase [Chloroflexota bacterium]
MFPLPPDQLEKARPLLAPLGEHLLVIPSILAGLTPATVYVDNVAEPHTAVTWFHGRVVIAGRVDAPRLTAVRHLLLTTYKNEAQAVGLDVFVIHATNEWQAEIANLLPDLKVIEAPRCYYRLDARNQEWETAVPDGLQLRRVDATLLADATLNNLDWVTEEMISERPSVADFLDKSFGYCLVHQNEVVAWCMSEYNTGSRCELGIATAEAWQRRGLAKVTATAVIAEALQYGMHDIGWICWAKNEPSVRTAESLGFSRVQEKLVYLFFW